ncbi:MAG: hypothetical protein HQ511_13485 [Rhodospirillales bacterium]|nr:hypothetical protein [Rhodospirillales bacterium]
MISRGLMVCGLALLLGVSPSIGASGPALAAERTLSDLVDTTRQALDRVKATRAAIEATRAERKEEAARAKRRRQRFNPLSIFRDLGQAGKEIGQMGADAVKGGRRFVRGVEHQAIRVLGPLGKPIQKVRRAIDKAKQKILDAAKAIATAPLRPIRGRAGAFLRDAVRTAVDIKVGGRLDDKIADTPIGEALQDIDDFSDRIDGKLGDIHDYLDEMERRVQKVQDMIEYIENIDDEDVRDALIGLIRDKTGIEIPDDFPGTGKDRKTAIQEMIRDSVRRGIGNRPGFRPRPGGPPAGVPTRPSEGYGRNRGG